jgi:hypothetical protein
MTIFYWGREVLITHDLFVLRNPMYQEFKINELEQVHVVRGDLHPMQVMLTNVAAGVFVVDAVTWRMFESLPGRFAAAVILAACVVLSVACAVRAPRVHELRASYQGYLVRLYESPDRQTFGQVSRGLVRALEKHDEHLDRVSVDA